MAVANRAALRRMERKPFMLNTTCLRRPGHWPRSGFTTRLGVFLRGLVLLDHSAPHEIYPVFYRTGILDDASNSAKRPICPSSHARQPATALRETNGRTSVRRWNLIMATRRGDLSTPFHALILRETDSVCARAAGRRSTSCQRQDLRQSGESKRLVYACRAAASGRRACAAGFLPSLAEADFSCPHAAIMSAPLGVRTGAAYPAL